MLKLIFLKKSIDNTTFAALTRLHCAPYTMCDHSDELNPDLIQFYSSGFAGIRQET